MKINKIVIATLTLTAVIQSTAFAKHSHHINPPSVNNAIGEVSPKAFVSHDPTIKVIAFDPLKTISVEQHYLVDTDYQFGDDEVVENVYTGDKSSWDITRYNNHVFVKARKINAASNMTVLTNKYAYHVFLTASYAAINSPKQIALVKFVYPQEEQAKAQEQNMLNAMMAPPSDICSDSSKYNLQYSFTGNQEQSPVRACDDGKFTYLKLRSTEDLPAIFAVDNTRHESVVNYHMQGSYIVIEKLAKQFTLRKGKTVTSIYNDHFIGDWAKVI